MIFEQCTLGELETNCYIVGSGPSVAVIDPADHGKALAAYIKDKGWTVDAILLTHGHFDHVGGVDELRRMTGAKVYMHQLDAPMLQDPGANAGLEFGYRITCGAADCFLQDGEALTAGGVGFRVLHTPGHSAGSVCYFCEEGGFVLCGDTVFYGSIGRCDPADYKTIIRSGKAVLALPPATRLYPGHGPATTVENEKLHNPYLR